jgi:tRNA(Ile)-lysidine synthase
MTYNKYAEDLDILEKINNNLIERHLIKPNQKILISVSGGQDSICLMQILYKLQKKWQWQLGIVHCDHRWHINSLVQAKHVAQLAAIMQITYYQAITIESVTKETVARNWRYYIIKNIAINHEYKVIVTGHTASDRIETLMYHLIRGTGLQGLPALNWTRKMDSPQCIVYPFCIKKRKKYQKIISKIFPDNINRYSHTESLDLVRPLLNITRTEVRYLVDYWKLPCWPDPSNSLMKMRRNRIRNRLIPYIRFHYNPQCDQALARWSEIVNAENVYLTNLTDFIISKIKIPLCQYNNYLIVGINLRYFRSVPQVFQRRILRNFIHTYSKRNLNFNYIEHVRLHCLSRQSKKLRNARNNLSNYVSFYLPGKMKVFIGTQFLFCLPYK